MAMAFRQAVVILENCFLHKFLLGRVSTVAIGSTRTAAVPHGIPILGHKQLDV